MPSSSRTVRIFLSSTFRDFGEERDLLVRRVFPALRARLKDRFVELVDVDLGRGITVEQAERGEVLPICLAEIDRARPFFVGMLGERYGWIPPADAFAQDLLENQGWLKAYRGGKSITELEILHGVLNDPAMARRAFFYIRSADFAHAKGGEYIAATLKEAARQTYLKDRIRRSGFPVFDDYPTPNAFAERLQEDLWNAIDEAFPADDVPDAFERESRKHESYELPRKRLYLGVARYVDTLTAVLDGGAQRVLIEGQSGGGKSALIANWIETYGQAHPQAVVFTHYTGASADAADPYALIRRLVTFIQRTTGSSEEILGDRQKLIESLSLWLGFASAWGAKEGKTFVFVLDALNGLSDLRDLRWLPAFLPEHVRLVVSCLPGEVMQGLDAKGDWSRLAVAPLNKTEAGDVLRRYLRRSNKSLAPDLSERVLAHPLAVNALFLRTLAEELRLFGVHEELSARIDVYLESATVDDLFERVLERVEGDCGADAVRSTMAAIWASRAGLSEVEIMGIAGLVPATWAPIRHALDEALLDSGGRLTFAHDYLRIAVSDRYLQGNGTLGDESQSDAARAARRTLHAELAEWFEAHAFTGTDLVDDARAAEEIPYQWREARDWGRLKACLTRRAMFEALDANQPDEEILSYWLDLEGEAGADLEQDYEAAWEKWAPNEAEVATSNLASKLQSFLRFAGRYGAFCLSLAQLALAIAEKVLGPDHSETGQCLKKLGNLLKAKGDYDSAEARLRRAFAIAEQALGPDHRETCVSLDTLSFLLQDMGDHDRAEPLLRRALAIRETILGPDHPETGTSLNSLALLLQDKGDYDTAEPLYRRALAIRERVLGPDHPSTGTSLNNLAELLRDKADDASAEPLLRRALAIADKVLGPDNSQTGTSLNNLALLLEDKGDYEGAEQLYRRALAIGETALGPEHPSTGTFLKNLASLLQYRGNHDASEALFRRALAIHEKGLGPDHPDTTNTMYDLGNVLAELGQTTEAEQLLLQELRILEQREGIDSSTVGGSLYNLGNWLFKWGRVDEAKKLLSREIAIAIQTEGADSESVATSHRNLGTRLRDIGRLEEAEKELLEAVRIARTISEPRAFVDLARLYFLQNRKDAGMHLLQEARAIAHAMDEPDLKLRDEIDAVLEK